jgi:hypothetical protein
MICDVVGGSPPERTNEMSFPDLKVVRRFYWSIANLALATAALPRGTMAQSDPPQPKRCRTKEFTEMAPKWCRTKEF